MDLRVDRDAEVPLGTQLAWKLRRLIEMGELGSGDRLPSVREAAAAAGVNVNTVRAVYGRLEREGLVSSEQGRGTFVRRALEPAEGHGADLDARRALRRQIARLESELARRPPPPTEARRAAPAGAGRRRAAVRRAAGGRARRAAHEAAASWTTPARRCCAAWMSCRRPSSRSPERRPSPSSSQPLRRAGPLGRRLGGSPTVPRPRGPRARCGSWPTRSALPSRTC